MKLITLAEAAEVLRLNENTLRKWARKSKVPAIKMYDDWRFDKDALFAWLDPSEPKRVHTSINEERTKREREEL